MGIIGRGTTVGKSNSFLVSYKNLGFKAINTSNT